MNQIDRQGLDWEMQENQEARPGMTRREALRKGTLAGLGMVWVTPAVTSIEMSQELAQATSGPKTTSTQASRETTTSNGENPTTSAEVDNTSATAGNQPTTTAAGDSSTSEDVKSQTTSQGPTGQEPQDQGPTAEASDEVLAGDLPFTGLPLEQLLPLAGGAIATGAAVVRAARDKKDQDQDEKT